MAISLKNKGLLYFKLRHRKPESQSALGSTLKQVNTDMTSCDSCPNYEALIR